ncbi:MAG: hypothetical protein KKD56_08970 [Acidobacteria bacterium]|nr:hypothetical protein [Acidobacteriota bacterium]MCG2817017.1 hypothetical protein [Candidatus Aminicenantes bacterium]MBU1339186.1 hypothetical protein [Acidobacteriota bacterium]MBU1473676.1 hypothetical protein [Acidobacteriota bacterium]MBU4329637.1 hypothetical protein [Acidobacteriota bacterium]
MKKFKALCCLLLLAACSSRFVPPAVPDLSRIGKERNADIIRLLAEADMLAAKGDYVSLKQAYTTYENLSSTLPYQLGHKEKQWRTALLLVLREKELAVYGSPHMARANQLARSGSFPEEYRILTRFVELIPFTTKGIANQEFTNTEELRQRTEWIRANLPILDFLRTRAPGDEFFAYLYLSLAFSLSDAVETVLDARRIAETLSESPLLGYRLAAGLPADVRVLEKLADEYPGFGEVFYFLGDASMSRQEIVSAEKNYSRAFSRIPESVNVTLSLGNIKYWFEELQSAFDFYQKTLDSLPEHHDALLGQAVCLGYLGRHKEAIEVLRTILLFGHARTGEAYYWIAWNRNMLGQYEAALQNALEAEKILEDNPLLFSLFGMIHFNQDELEEAEIRFLAANRLDPLYFEPAFHLGKINARKENWIYSGYYFEAAATCCLHEEGKLTELMEQIQEMSVEEERKQRFLARKKRQMAQIQLEKATSDFNAGAGYYNAGYKEKALEFLEKSAGHTAFEERAKTLMDRLKKE